jgi:hypothetical protein
VLLAAAGKKHNRRDSAAGKLATAAALRCGASCSACAEGQDSSRTIIRLNPLLVLHACLLLSLAHRTVAQPDLSSTPTQAQSQTLSQPPHILLSHLTLAAGELAVLIKLAILPATAASTPPPLTAPGAPPSPPSVPLP